MFLAKRYVVLLAVVLCPVAAWACDSGTVRDAAFHAKRDLYRLLLIAEPDDAEASNAFDSVEAWLVENGRDLNVRPVRVQAEGEMTDWGALGLPGPPPDMPIVALVRDPVKPDAGEALRVSVVDYWTPCPSSDDLAVAFHSPVRARLQDALIEWWAVVLYSPRPGGDGGNREALIQDMAARWAQKQSPGITVVTLDRTDPAERLLVRLLGLSKHEEDWAAIVFGKGRVLIPPMVGDEISVGAIDNALESLAVQCTCLQEYTTIGVDMPFAWADDMNGRVIGLTAPRQYSELTVLEQAAQHEQALEREVLPRDRRLVAAAILCALLAAAVPVVVVAGLLVRSRRRRLQRGKEHHG